MSLDLIPRSFWSMPSRLPSILDDESDWASFLPSSGLSISEDEKNVYIEAALPGVNPDNIEVTFDKGVLWVRGSEQESEADKAKKFYRKASSSFSYRISVPGKINETEEPDAVYKHGIMKITFAKQAEVQPKKISIRQE